MAATCLVIPVLEAEPVVGLLRRRHTRDGAEEMPPHVTLIYPFTDDSLVTEERIREVREALASFPQFDFQLAAVGRFTDPEESYLWLAPDPAASFIEIVDALETRFSEHPAYGGAFTEVIPHLTVVSSSDEETLDQVEAELAGALPIRARATSAWLMQHVDGRWRRRAELVLPTARSVELRALAQAIADALPATVEEVVLTGSVSRGVADDVSDIEMLIVTGDELELSDCFALAAAAGLSELGTWGRQGMPTKRVSGYRDGAPIELVWWSRAYAETAVDGIFAGEVSTTADALANGVALRTVGLLAAWQERLRHYPDDLAAQQIEDAALTWGGFAAAGLLTIIRPGERAALVERMVDDASRVVRIVFALNRVWQPTLKRLADRTASLAHKPDSLAERIEHALTEPDPRRAALAMTELQADTVALAPDGPNVDRARRWLADAREILEERPSA